LYFYPKTPVYLLQLPENPISLAENAQTITNHRLKSFPEKYFDNFFEF